MPDHKYITERIERQTNIKGTFKGKFVGHLDPDASDSRHERFFDIEIVDGDIYTSPANLFKWSDQVDLSDFSDASSFTVNRMDGMRITLQCVDNTEKYFKIKLKELKLIHCKLSRQTYVGNDVYGLLEGDVLSYVLHRDTYVNELGKTEFDLEKEESRKPVKPVGADRVKQPEKQDLPEPVKAWSRDRRRRGSAFFRSSFYGKFFSKASVASLLIVALLTGVYRIFTKSPLTGTVAQRAAKTDQLPAKIMKQRKDSFDSYFESAKTCLLHRNNKEAITHFEKAAEFASEDEVSLVNNETNALYASLAHELEKESKYKQAAEVYSTLVNSNVSDPAYLYSRAMCYIKIGDKREAIADLRKALELGDKPSQLLYDQLNPLKKRLAYTVVRCRDGTVSSSQSRRGTCSSHGGVKDWEEEVYEEYREFN